MYTAEHETHMSLQCKLEQTSWNGTAWSPYGAQRSLKGVWLLAGRGHLRMAPSWAGCLETAAMAGHERVRLRRRITAHESQVALQKYGPQHPRQLALRHGQRRHWFPCRMRVVL